MKKLNLASLALLLCLVIACVKDIPHREFAAKEIESNYVSIDEARDRVINLVSQIDNPTKGTSSRRYIIEEYQLEGLNTKTSLIDTYPLVYVFNFNDNNGFAIASGDNRMPPIFCITDQGHFTDSITIPESVAILLSMIEDEYKSVTRNGNDSFVTEIDSLPIMPGNGIGGEGGDYIPPTYNIYSNWVNSIPEGQIIPTNWGQRYPFNEMCQLENGANALVGCVAVAVGQIMYYWKHDAVYNGHIYNWRLMSQFKDSASIVNSANKDVQNLLSDLGRPENLDMDYGLNDSKAFCDKIVRTFNNFGYTSGGQQNEYNENIIKSEIDAGRPIIICGKSHKNEIKILGITVHIEYNGGHEWIIDQYYTQSRTVNTYNTATGQLISTTTENSTMVHCNFGWANEMNGYYLSGKFYTNPEASTNGSDVEGNYKYQIKIHSGIHP